MVQSISGDEGERALECEARLVQPVSREEGECAAAGVTSAGVA